MATSATSPVVSVHVLLADAKTTTCVAKNINRAKLWKLSMKARTLLDNGGSKFPGVPGHNHVVFFARDVHPDSASKVCSWIEQYDFGKSVAEQALDVKDINQNNSSYEFPELVKLYYTAYAFHIPALFRGDKLRDGIREYVHMAPLSLNEFVMLHECIPFDHGMLKTVQHEVMRNKIQLPRPPPEMDAIEKYAKQIGVWDEMEVAEEKLRGQKAYKDKMEANARKHADEARIRAHQQAHRGMGV